MKFDEWSEAEEWAGEVNRSLEPLGTFSGDETLMQSRTVGRVTVEMIKRVAEAIAIGERTHEVFLHITEYIVVTNFQHDGESTYSLHIADNYEDAMNTYQDTVIDLLRNEIKFHEHHLNVENNLLQTCTPHLYNATMNMAVYHSRMVRELSDELRIREGEITHA
jgi:hypothetical protein